MVLACPKQYHFSKNLRERESSNVLIVKTVKNTITRGFMFKKTVLDRSDININMDFIKIARKFGLSCSAHLDHSQIVPKKIFKKIES